MVTHFPGAHCAERTLVGSVLERAPGLVGVGESA